MVKFLAAALFPFSSANAFHLNPAVYELSFDVKFLPFPPPINVVISDTNCGTTSNCSKHHNVTTLK